MTNCNLRRALLLASALSLSCWMPGALAADKTWTGAGTDNNWTTGNNWGGTAPVTGDNLIFSGTTRQNNTNNISNLTNNWARFDTGGFTLYGNQWALNPSTAGIFTNSAGTNTIATPLVIIPAAKYWSVAPGTELRLTGVITNTANSGTSSGWLNLTNTGTVRIMNSAKSTRGMDLFSGTVIVDGGFVDANNDGIVFKPATGMSVGMQIINNGTVRIGGGGNFRIGNSRNVLGTAGGPSGYSQVDLNSGTLELYGSAVTVYVADNVIGTRAVFNQNGGLVWGSAGSGNTVTLGNAASVDGTYNLNGGTLWIAQVRQGNPSATNIVFNFNGGTLKPTASSTTFFQGLLNANVLNGGAIIDTTNFNITIGQNLAAGGTGGLTKLGSGTLTLSGLCSYTGPTVVSNGTLAVSTAFMNGGGGIVVADGATLNTTMAGSPWNASSLKVGTSSTSTLTLNLGTFGNPGVATFVVGNVTAAGNAVINITGAGFTPGQFPLIQFTTASGLGNFHLGSVPAGVSATLVQTANTLSLNISSVVKQIAWRGTANNQWDTTSVDWVDLNNANNPTNYAQANGFGDMVSFDDGATGSTAINLGLAVSPVSMTFNNFGFAYSFAGAGKITGVTAVTLNGTQPVTLSTVNDYTNGTTINNAVVYVDANQALGLGPVTFNGGTLASASTTGHRLPSTLVLNSDTVTTFGNLANTGTLTLAGKLDFGGGVNRSLTLNSDVVVTGGMTDGGFALKNGPGRLLVLANSQQGGLVSQQQGDVIIDGARLDSLNGWRIQNVTPGTTLRLAVTNGGTFTMSTNSGNLRIGLAGGDNSSDNVLDIAGTVNLTPSAGMAGNSAVTLGLSGANAYLYLRPGGLLITRAVTGSAPANSVVHLNGGTLMPLADEPNFLTGLTSAYIDDGGVTFDTTNANITVGQALLAGGVGGLTKAGTGSLTLNGADSYTGPTTVNAGKLILGAAHAASGSITVASNATLAFLSTAPGVSGAVPNVTGVTGSALEAQFTGLTGNPTAPAGSIASLVLNGTVGVNLVAASVSVGQFPLFAYGAISGSGQLVPGQLPHGVIATVVTNTSAKTIDLVVTAVNPLSWVGTTSGNWNTTTTNWSVLGSPSLYSQGDNVRFDDSASNSVVTMTLSPAPGGVTVSNTALAYQLNASGTLGLTGSMSLVKDGTNSLTLNASNTFTGGITVKAGTLVTGTASALGSTNGTTVVLSGGTLDINAQNLDSDPVVLTGSGVGGQGALVNTVADQNNALKNVTLAGDTVFRTEATLGIRTAADTDVGFIGNGHKLTKIGSGQVNLNGGQTNPGSTIWETDLGDVSILAGTLSFQRRMTMGRSTNIVTAAPGATLLLFALNTSMPLQVKPVYLTNATLACNGNNATEGSAFGGPVTVVGGSNFFSALAGTTLTLDGPVQGAGSVYTSGLIVYGGTNTYTGSTVISNSTLQLAATGQLTGTTNIGMLAGAAFDVSAVAPWGLGASQTLSGFGTVNGSVLANGAVWPGATTGTLTFNNNLTLAGTTVLEITKDGGLTNDSLTVNGTLTYGGQLQVLLRGSTPLAVNDTFKLFTFAAAPTGSFTLSLPAAYTWDTTQLAANGTIRVTGLATPPQIGGITVSGGNLVLTGSGGVGGATYYLYSSTNVALPLASWAPFATNTFAPNGNFTNTFPVNVNEAQRFFILREP